MTRAVLPRRFDLTFGEDSPETRERLRELILYISDRSAFDPNFGRTKLNKILYFADFVSFRERGKPITGAKYMRWEHGPMPRHLKPITDKMVHDGELDEQSRDSYIHTQQRFIPKRKARTEIFNEEELLLVDAIIKELEDDTATDVSIKTHGRVWKITSNGDPIPYEAAFVSDAGLTEGAFEWASKLIQKYDKIWRAEG